MVYEFLQRLKGEVSPEEFAVILDATTDDIKFNRVGFNKRTSPTQFVNICNGCKSVVLRGI